jgi:GAF domain-containing protein
MMIKNSYLQHLLKPLLDFPELTGLTLKHVNGKTLSFGEKIEEDSDCEVLPLFFDYQSIGTMAWVGCPAESLPDDCYQQIQLSLAPVLKLFELPQFEKGLEYYESVWEWVKSAKNLAPRLCDWTGIYFHESFLFSKLAMSPNLIVGPYAGEGTEHMRIPIDKGLCGLAFRERRVVNMADVHADPRHIACSLKTRSELILPLFDHNGVMVAELDIDSHTPGAFTLELEEVFTRFAKTFVLPKSSFE